MDAEGDTVDKDGRVLGEDEEGISEEEEWTYSKAGVSLEGGDKTISEIWKLISTTFRFRRSKNGQPLDLRGHFAGLIDIGAGDRLLAVHADNVGTKVLVAQLLGKYDTVGIDLVAMNVNDLVCVGAEPIALLDYLAVEKYNPDLIREIVKGIVEGAKRASIAIVGGETASVPDIIHGARTDMGFDLAGTSIGLLDRNSLITGEKMKPGDAVVGLASNGIHSNGLTLARKVLLEAPKLDVNDNLPGTDLKIGEELLTPTKIYSPEVYEITREVEAHGLAHITGGAFTKLRRIGRYAHVGFKLNQMPKAPQIFESISKLGRITEEEMYKTYNMGIGFCIIVPKRQVETVLAIAGRHGTSAFPVGEVVKEESITVKTPRGTSLKY
ncbi:MAG: phosphoribosylformylglycinamidine cyclo-ligase [Promethearchaeati archaeon SRVP18_Atabeyarchaeia-1]